MLSAIKTWAMVGFSMLLCVTIWVLGYMVFLDGTVFNPVVTYDTQTFQTNKSIYEPGDMVEARRQFAKHRDIKGKIQWSLVNHRIISYTTKELALPTGVIDAWSLVEKLPEVLESGEYHFEGLLCYQVNPLRVVSYPIRTEPFLVMPKANIIDRKDN